MSARGVFVVFEGGDGVGKSTQVELLCTALAPTRPGGRPHLRAGGHRVLGAKIRRLVLDPATGDLAPRAEALLYAADKAQHLYAVVRPALARGAVVVCDRYVDSMLAYQGAGRVLAVAEVEQVARWATEDLRPDLTVLLDVDPAPGRARQGGQGPARGGRGDLPRAGPRTTSWTWPRGEPAATSCWTARRTVERPGRRGLGAGPGAAGGRDGPGAVGGLGQTGAMSSSRARGARR